MGVFPMEKVIVSYMSTILYVQTILFQQPIHVKGVSSSSLSTTSSQILPVTKTSGQDSFRLKCPSLKPTTNFTYVIWILHRAHIVISRSPGQAGNVDPSKYSYVGTTGELQINNVSSADAGVYRCIVQYSTTANGIETFAHETSAVELELGQSYGADDYKDNIIRASLAAGGVLFIFIVSCMVYSFRWKESPILNEVEDTYSPQSQFENVSLDDDEEDGPGAMWNSKITSKPTTGLSNMSYKPDKDQVEFQKFSNTKIFVIPDSVCNREDNDGNVMWQENFSQETPSPSYSSAIMMKMMMIDGKDGDSGSGFLKPSCIPPSPPIQDSTFSFKTCSRASLSRNGRILSTNPVLIASPESTSSILTVDSEIGPKTVIHIM